MPLYVVGSADDDEVTFISQSVMRALVDYSHLREHCLTHPYVPSSAQTYCAKCYCAVCDIPAASCRSATTWYYSLITMHKVTIESLQQSHQLGGRGTGQSMPGQPMLLALDTMAKRKALLHVSLPTGACLAMQITCVNLPN